MKKMHQTIKTALEYAEQDNTLESWEFACDLITGAKCGLQMRGGKKAQKLVNELHPHWVHCMDQIRKFVT